MEEEVLKIYTLDELIDKYIGKRGTTKRDNYENKLKLELQKRPY
jgi:HTH-type transcriptional regulator/antitoxin HipB